MNRAPLPRFAAPTARAPWAPALALAALGCGPSLPLRAADPSPLHEGPAEIQGISLSCAPDAGRWSLLVATSAWSGVGLLLWGDRDDRIEAHNFYSVNAEADGSGDCLRLPLSVVADPREANPGASTRFGCERLPALSARLFVADTQAEVWTDCRAWGPAPGLFEGRDGVPGCDRALQGEPSADEALDTGGAATPVGLVEGELGACG